MVAEQHITYLFCVHDNHPIVLVDQTTNGNYIAVLLLKKQLIKMLKAVLRILSMATIQMMID